MDEGDNVVDLSRRFAQLRQGTLDPVEVMREFHGIELDKTECQGCERVVTDRGQSCPGCGRPYPRRCATRGENGQRACGNYVEPWQDERGRWYEGPAICHVCMHRDRVVQIRERVCAALPEDVAALPFKSMPHRALAKRACDQVAAGDKCAVYVHGNTGSGKTVLVAKAALDAAIQRNNSDVLWVSEIELLNATKRMMRDDAAAALIERATSCEILVIDELFSLGHRHWTDHALMQLTYLLCHRLDRRKATFITSNEPLVDAEGRSLWETALDSRVASRWAAGGIDVECSGRDIRTEGME